jgi:hypothetical protein
MNRRGFETIVRPEAVLDRAETPHRVKLFDVAAKVAGVLPLGEVEAWLEDRAYPEAAR